MVCSGLSHHLSCWRHSLMPVRVPTAPLPVRLPANVPGKQQGTAQVLRSPQPHETKQALGISPGRRLRLSLAMQLCFSDK